MHFTKPVLPPLVPSNVFPYRQYAEGIFSFLLSYALLSDMGAGCFHLLLGFGLVGGATFYSIKCICVQKASYSKVSKVGKLQNVIKLKDKKLFLMQLPRYNNKPYISTSCRHGVPPSSSRNCRHRLQEIPTSYIKPQV